MRTIPTLLAALAVVILGCVTINVYFPEAAIQDLAERIEEEVVREAAATDGASMAPNPRPRRAWRAIWAGTVRTALRLTASPAMAQQPSANTVPAPAVTNPAIRAIIESRAARLDDLNALKAQKVVGESNEGLVEIRDLASLELRERANAQRLVKAENDDREALYREIAAATNVDLKQLPQIRKTYAGTLHANAKPGELIQLEDGRWVEKPAR